MKFLLCWIMAILWVIASSITRADEKILNIYTWSGEIPTLIIEQFEKETGIHVNYSSFDSNQVMYAKLRTNSKGYDIVEPSCYYIQRMHHQGMLEKLDKTKLPNFKYLDPFFVNQIYDPQNLYSIPFVWGVTGIFFNKDYVNEKAAAQWADLLNPVFLNRLMLLDEARAVFSIAFRMLGYSINDNNPEHIKEAYRKLKELMPNVRLFNTDAVLSILIDEDATIGMAWNADVYSALQENSKLQFVFPKDGFEIWVDTFLLLKTAPHKENAYQFLNFLMRPDVAKAVSLNINYSTTNLAAKNALPPKIKNNPILYPSYEILRHGEFQSDHGDQASMLLEKYWELLKMGG